jgi:hypothetical protein
MRFLILVLALPLTLGIASCKKPTPAGEKSVPAASGEAEQTGVRFKRKLPSAGTTLVVDDTFEMHLDMKNAKGGVGTTANRETRKRKRTVKRANDQFVTQAAIEYLDHKTEEESDGKKKEIPSKVKGKKYLVEWDGSGTVVSYEGGGKVTDPEEKDLVAEGEWDIGQHGDLAAFIPDRPLKVGESFSADEKALRALLGVDKEDKITVEKATFTFSGTRQENGKTYGLFDAKLSVNAWSKKEDIELAFEVSGKLSVDLDTAWVRDFSLDGPVKVKSEKSKDRPSEVQGTGTVKMSSLVKYE